MMIGRSYSGLNSSMDDRISELNNTMAYYKNMLLTFKKPLIPDSLFIAILDDLIKYEGELEVAMCEQDKFYKQNKTMKALHEKIENLRVCCRASMSKILTQVPLCFHNDPNFNASLHDLMNYSRRFAKAIYLRDHKK